MSSEPQLFIRPTVSADLPALLQLAEEVWPSSDESDEAILAKCRRGVMVTAVYDGSVCGYAAAFSWEGELPDLADHAPETPGPVWWHIHDVAVSSAFQGRGVGAALFGHLVDEGRRRGFSEMRAIAVSTGGLAVLTSLGFAVEPELVSPASYHGAPVLVLRAS